MSIKNLKRFYTAGDASSFVVYESGPTFATLDEETMSLTDESAKSTKSDLPRKKKAKRVRFLNHSGLSSFRSKLGYPPLKDSSVQWKDRSWTPKFIVRLWQERYRECPCKVCQEEINFWFSLCQDWGWDAWWCVYIIRKVRKERNYAPIPDFSTFTFW